MTEVIFGECIFEVWPAPGVRERLSKGRGRSLPTTGRLSRAPGAGQTSKTHSKNKAGLLSYIFSSCADVAAGGAAVHPLREFLYNASWPKWLVIFDFPSLSPPPSMRAGHSYGGHSALHLC